MSDIYKFPTTDVDDDATTLWLAKLDRGLSVNEEEELQQWLMDDSSRRESFLEIAELWDCADSLSRLAEICPRERPSISAATKRVSIAATICLLIGSLVLAARVLQPGISVAPVVPIAVSPQEEKYQTAVGEQSAVILADGTKLLLNTNTALSVEYSVDHRHIKLLRGELHVSVTKDEKRPLTVYANGKAVRAIGTAFNVEMLDDYEIELLVTEGKVSIESLNAEFTESNKNQTIKMTEDTINVSAGYQLSINREERFLAKVDLIELDNKLAWRSGNLIFKGEYLESVVEEINRYTPIEFEFADENIKQIKVVGLFKTGDVKGLVAMLERNFQLSVNYKEYENKVVLSKLSSTE